MIFCNNINLNTKVFFLIIYSYFGLNGNSQNNHQLGLLPNINFEVYFKNSWMLNSKIEFRQILREGPLNVNKGFEYDYVHTDLASVISRKISDSNFIGVGYLIRLKNDYLLYRLVQRYVFKRKYNSVEMVHRFTTDQSFEYRKTPEYRFRYRIGCKFMLMSKVQNSNEMYFKFNNEYLNIFNDNQYDMEVRILPMLGYKFTNSHELEFGFDYRISSFINNDLEEQRFWISINWNILL